MPPHSQTEDRQEQRAIFQELAIRFVSAFDTDKQRFLEDYPVLLSSTGRRAVAELSSLLERQGAEKSHPVLVVLQKMVRDAGANHSSLSMRDVMQDQPHVHDRTRTEIPIPGSGHIDILPVTNSHYARFLTETGYPSSEIKPQAFLTEDDDPELAKMVATVLEKAGVRGFSFRKAEEAPDASVVEVNWFDAIEYARWARKVLPSADVWDAAFRAAPSQAIASNSTPEKIPLYEWTSTSLERDYTPHQMVIVRGGPGDVTKEPVDDLWDQLTFRCYRPAPKLSEDQLLEEVKAAELQRQMRLRLGFDQLDGVDAVQLHALASQVVYGNTSLDEALNAIRNAASQMESATVIGLLDASCRYMRNRTDYFPEPGVEPQLLITLGRFGLALASTLQSEERLIQAKWSLGQALIAARDDSEASSIIEPCLEYFERIGNIRSAGEALLALGTAEYIGNLMFNDDPVGTKKALEHFIRAHGVFRELQLPVLTQRVSCCIAQCLVRFGEMQQVFWLCRHSLADTAFFEHPREEIVGMLRIGNVLVDSNFHDLAIYVHKCAFAMSSRLGDPELIAEAQLYIAIAYGNVDLRTSCAHLAKALEVGVFFETSSLLRTINVAVNFCSSSLTGNVCSALLSYLTDFESDWEFSVQIARLARILITRCVMPAADLSEEWEQIQQRLPSSLTLKQQLAAEAVRAVVFSTTDPDRALAIALKATELARDLSSQKFSVVAQMAFLFVLKDTSDWKGLEQRLDSCRSAIEASGDSSRVTALLDLASTLWFNAGRISAAIEAADEAAIQSRQFLDRIHRANINGNQHLLLSRLFYALGSSKALIEAFAGYWSFVWANNGFGQCEAALLQALALIDKGDLGLAQRQMKLALQILSIPGTRNHPRLHAELAFVSGAFLHRSGNFIDSRAQLEQAASSFKSLGLLDEEMKAQIRLLAVFAHLDEDGPLLDGINAVLPRARSRRRPLELLEILGIAARRSLARGQLDEAEQLFNEAVSHYLVVRDSIETNPVLRKQWLLRYRELFDTLILRVLLPLQKMDAALSLLQRTKAASLEDLLQEATVNSGLPQNAQIRALWHRMRELEVQLEEGHNLAGNEDEEADLRYELSSARKQFRSIAALEMGVQHEASEVHYSDFTSAINASATAIVDFFLCDGGAMAFVILPGLTELRTAAVDGEALLQALSLLEGPEDRYELALEMLFKALFACGPEPETLMSLLRKSKARRLVFIPSGWLSRLPLHAATDSSSKACILDEFEAISYAPSLSVLYRCMNRPRRQPERLLAVQDPTESLRSARVESEALCALVADSKLFKGGSATRASVLTALGAVDVVHFACHGFFSAANPLRSGIRLVDDDLRLAEVYIGATVLEGALVSIASCESGTFDKAYADEFVGFLSAFLYAGASAAVGGLWKVDDLSTSLLFQKYYQTMIETSASAAASLAAAQRWLRDSTVAELGLIALYERQYLQSGREDVEAFKAMRYFDSRPDERPFSHPFYWAGFALYGATA